MNGPNSSLYYKSGQLKVTLWKIVDFEYDRPITAEVRLPVWGGADGDPDTGRSMEVVPSHGVAELRIAFKFNYDSQKHIEFYLLEKEEEIVSANWPLEKVLSDGKEETAIPFHPRGKLMVEMIWLDMPDHFPQWITVSKLWWQPATDTTFDLIRPRIEVDLGDEQFFTCVDGEERGGALHWPDRHFDRSYKGEEDISVRLTDSTGIDYATTTIDIWGLLLAEPKPCLEGEIRASKADGSIAGKLHIKLAFWDTPEEKERPAKQFDSSDTFADEDRNKLGTARSSSIDTSSSDSAPPVQRVNSSEFVRALDDAKKAADAAEDDAAKAQEIAKMLTPDRIQGAPAKNAAREAEQAALSARNSAQAVRALVERLELNRPQEAESLDSALRNVLDTARAVRKDKDTTADEAMNAVVLSARASARAAKDSALSAKSHSVDCQKVATPHLNIKQCRQLVEEVTHCAENADGEASTAHNCAEDAEDAYDYSEALQAASTAAKAAKKAREDELAAEDIYRKLLALARKAEKYAERKARDELEKEETMHRKAAEERERARNEEHEAEEIRRRNRLLMDGDAAEQVVYSGARAYGFRQKHEDYEQTFGNPYSQNSGNNLLCCGPAVSSNRSVERHPSPTLLVTSVPPHELRGHDPHLQFEKLTEKDDGSGGICGLGDVLYGDDGLMESYIYKRASCWCFGCGCMRCCGEC